VSEHKDWNEVFRYRPYQGGAGPSKREVEQFNSLLRTALILTGMVPTSEVDEDGTEFVVVGSRRVTYDRWGYCNEDGNPEDEIDQVDLNTAVAYFLKEYDV